MIDYALYQGDCFDIVESIGRNDVKLLITDTPPETMVPSYIIWERFIKIVPVMKDDGLMVIFRDKPIRIDFPIISNPHSSFKGNVYEKSVCAALYIEKYTNPGDLVLDPFCGYSSVGIAAINMNRNYIGIDISPDAIKESEMTIYEYC